MHKNALKLERKTRNKSPSTTVDYSLLRISCLDYAFSGSPVEGQQLQLKDKKKRKRKGKIKIIQN